MAKRRPERSNVRTGLGTDAIAQALIDNLYCLLAKLPQHATLNDWYIALACTARDRTETGTNTAEPPELSSVVRATDEVFRVLAARWLGLPPAAGSNFLLDTATVSVLSHYHGIPAVKRWNAPLVS